jgi:amino acid transporter
MESPRPTSPGDDPVRAPIEKPPAEQEKAAWSLHDILFGKPRDLRDRQLFHRLSLVPFLAWIGLGADGLSSSAYGPEEAFRTLGEHSYLALPLAFLMATTVWVISACYMRIIEVFPHGGGGYLVATKLLGQRAGVVAGSALLVDYVLTITVSVAAAGDALFSLIPPDYRQFKVPADLAIILFLTVVNIRGVRESILILLPIFMTFLVTHAALILTAIWLHVGDFEQVGTEITSGFRSGLATLGLLGMVGLFFQAYSLGAGTYTGIEAVSNGLNVMRAPQVQTGKRTMVYMAISLSFTAAGLILCYLLLHLAPSPDKSQTMNAILTGDVLRQAFPDAPGLRTVLLLVTLVSEGALLIVAAQAGFIGGPRVMANMAVDSLLPHRFAALSDRFTTSNGIILMSAASIAALVATGGDTRTLVLMYSINVFITFSLAQFGMVRYWWGNRGKEPVWRKRLALFVAGFAFCAMILAITIYEKFGEGGWITLAVTGGLVALCMLVRRYYRRVGRQIAQVQLELADVREENARVMEYDPRLPTAVVLVNSFGGLGMHTILKVLQVFPGYFRNFHFVSVGTIDIATFKGKEELQRLEENTEEALKRYVEYVNGLGFPARYSKDISTDPVDKLEDLCREVARSYRTVVFFSGKVIFERERWYHAIFHNMTAYTLQKRLLWAGLMMVILPVRLRENVGARPLPGERAASGAGGASPGSRLQPRDHSP